MPAKNANKKDNRRDVPGYGNFTVFEDSTSKARKKQGRDYQNPILIKIDIVITICFWLTFSVKIERIFP